MKKYLLAILAGLALLAGCNNKEIEEINSRLDDLENKDSQVDLSIESIQAQIVQVQDFLDRYESFRIDFSSTLQDLVERLTILEGNDYQAIEEEITFLGNMCDVFNEQIGKLRESVGSLSGDVSAWVESYKKTLTEVSSLKLTVNRIDDSLLQLQTSLETLDQDLSEKINDVSTELSGEINKLKTLGRELSDSILECSNQIEEMQTSLTEIEDSISSLEKGLEALRKDVDAILSSVQSVVVVPYYQDGSVKMGSADGDTLLFEIYPLDAAARLALVGTSCVSLDAVKTQTRSYAGQPINLNVISVGFDGRFFEVISDASPLDLTGESAYSARLRLSDAAITRSSEYFPISLKEETPVWTVQTGDCTDLGFTSAKIRGWCNQDDIEGLLSARFGIEYSASPLDEAPLRAFAESKDGEGKFCCSLEGLSSGTKYYYRAFVLFNGITTYGQISSFTTKSLELSVSTLDATGIGETRATLHSEIDIVAEGTPNEVNVWFLYSKTSSGLESLKSSGTVAEAVSGQDGGYKVSLTGLDHNTQYWYVACIQACDKIAYGEVESFSTLDFTVNVDSPQSKAVTYYSARMDAKVNVESTENLTVYAKFYYSPSETTAEGLIARGKSVQASVSVQGECTASVNNLIEKTKYYYTVVVNVLGKECRSAVGSFETTGFPVPEAVDLGLSVKWASFNVGAERPEGFGNYYAFGECSEKKKYGWDSYAWCGGSMYSLTKYCTNPTYGGVDGKTTLEDTDDVAREKVGEGWRIPTEAEFRELVDGCTWVWVDKGRVKGYDVYSKVPGSTNKIFLPEAGCLYARDGYIEECGRYWTSSVNEDYPYNAYGVNFYESDINVTSSARYYGRTIRPVKP